MTTGVEISEIEGCTLECSEKLGVLHRKLPHQKKYETLWNMKPA